MLATIISPAPLDASCLYFDAEGNNLVEMAQQPSYLYLFLQQRVFNQHFDMHQEPDIYILQVIFYTKRAL